MTLHPLTHLLKEVSRLLVEPLHHPAMTSAPGPNLQPFSILLRGQTHGSYVLMCLGIWERTQHLSAHRACLRGSLGDRRIDTDMQCDDTPYGHAWLLSRNGDTEVSKGFIIILYVIDVRILEHSRMALHRPCLDRFCTVTPTFNHITLFLFALLHLFRGTAHGWLLACHAYSNAIACDQPYLYK